MAAPFHGIEDVCVKVCMHSQVHKTTFCLLVWLSVNLVPELTDHGMPMSGSLRVRVQLVELDPLSWGGGKA